MTDIEHQWQQQNEHMRAAILNRIIPEVADLWSKKNSDYAGQQMFLGLKAQFCDINRKFWKLKAFLWDGKKAEFEDPIEVCKDMIGHLLMTIYFLEEEKKQPGIKPDDICPAVLPPGPHSWTGVSLDVKRCDHCGGSRKLRGAVDA